MSMRAMQNGVFFLCPSVGKFLGRVTYQTEHFLTFAQKKFYLKLEPIPGNGIQLGSLTTSNYSHVIDF